MTENLMPIKVFLGKYYPEIYYTSTLEKYKNTKLDTFFEQRFYIQNNKVQMIVDPKMIGLTVIVVGNEIHVSKELYDHPDVQITNTLENGKQNCNPISLYNETTFSTIAYLACQNHTMFRITADIDEPIYVKYKSEYETFYNSVLVFEISENINVEIVEEIESLGALNSVTNYILHPYSKLSLSTFYQNQMSAISFVYRNIIAQDHSSYTHSLLGRGSSNVIDENKIYMYEKTTAEFMGIINSNGKQFHSILYVQPANLDYSVAVDYRDILCGNADVTFFPVVLGHPLHSNANISVSNVTLGPNVNKDDNDQIIKYLSGIIDRVILDRMVGVKRFYDNKKKFLQFL